MRRLLVIVLVLLPARMPAAQGLVATRTGHTYQGHIRLGPEGVLVVNLDAQQRRLVPISNLTGLWLWPEPDAGFALTNPGASWGDLPAAWRSQDVGPTRTAGQANAYGGFFCVCSAGTNVAAHHDAFHFVHKPVGPRSDLVARLTWPARADPSAQAGLMLREGLRSQAACVFVGLTAGRIGFVGWRSTEGERFQPTTEVPLASRCWLRLKRQAELVTAFSSVDGRRWRLLDSVRLQWAETLQAGLAVTGGRTGRRTMFGFDRVQEGPALWTGPMLPRLQLVSGSVLVGLIDRVDDQAVHFLGAPPREPVATRCVAQIVFDWPRTSTAAAGSAARAGVLLSSGQFVEGAFRGLEQGTVRISSVLLGLQRFDAEGEVAAVFLRAAPAPASPVVVRTVEGSLYRGRIQALGEGELLVEEPALGLCRLPVYELAEVRWPD